MPQDFRAARLAIARMRASSAYMRALHRLRDSEDPASSDALESINAASIAADEATTPEQAERAALRAELESFDVTGAMDDVELVDQYRPL